MNHVVFLTWESSAHPNSSTIIEGHADKRKYKGSVRSHENFCSTNANSRVAKLIRMKSYDLYEGKGAAGIPFGSRRIALTDFAENGLQDSRRALLNKNVSNRSSAV